MGRSICRRRGVLSRLRRTTPFHQRKRGGAECRASMIAGISRLGGPRLDSVAEDWRLRPPFLQCGLSFPASRIRRAASLVFQCFSQSKCVEEKKTQEGKRRETREKAKTRSMKRHSRRELRELYRSCCSARFFPSIGAGSHVDSPFCHTAKRRHCDPLGKTRSSSVERASVHVFSLAKTCTTRSAEQSKRR